MQNNPADLIKIENSNNRMRKIRKNLPKVLRFLEEIAISNIN